MENALSMPPEQIASVRQEVIEYYETHLSVEGFQKKFYGQLETIREIIFPYILEDGLIPRKKAAQP